MLYPEYKPRTGNELAWLELALFAGKFGPYFSWGLQTPFQDIEIKQAELKLIRNTDIQAICEDTTKKRDMN